MSRIIINYSIVTVLTIFCFYYSYAEETQIVDAKEKVIALLDDPDSAKFRNIQIITNSKGDDSVCGEINARNRFGGYVGFKKFNVTNGKVNIVSEEKQETMRLYNLSGAAGPEAELTARLELEAFFNCNVIWNLLINVIVEGQSKEEAIDAAIIAVKNRAEGNSGSLNEDQEKMLRSQLQLSLEQTLLDKKQVRAIKKNPEYQKQVIFPNMYMTTITALKEQVKRSQNIMKN